jgi:hypothetical protein
MFARLTVATLFLGLSLSLSAETPNLNPGLWEYTNTMSFESEFPIPDQTDTTTDCLTEDQIREGDAFFDDMDGCETTTRNMRRDGMDFVLECQAPDGTSVTMTADMEFNGDTASGTITGDMETPMGPMKMTIEMQSRRVSDC